MRAAEVAPPAPATARGEIRIATVLKSVPLTEAGLDAMDTIRWLRVSEHLATAGFRVDMVLGPGASLKPRHPNLRYIDPTTAQWSRYHVIKTLYQGGFRYLLESGGGSHPFIVSRLGSVVGSVDDVPGVHFIGSERQALWEMQERIAVTSRYVVHSSDPNLELWRRQFPGSPVLTVKTGVDRVVPPPRRNPYQGLAGKVVMYAGNLYTTMQRHVNLHWQDRLNRLGARLKASNVRLVFVGRGLTDRLDRDAVVNIGPVPLEDFWDYQYFADAGLALAQGPVHNNEASKIYYYLRTGLPVVSEEPIPNNHVILEAGCGSIAPYNDDHALAASITDAVNRRWERQSAIEHVLSRYTWARRFAEYERVIDAHFLGGDRSPRPR